MLVFFFFKQKTAYEMRISDWSSDVCSSDLPPIAAGDELERARGDFLARFGNSDDDARTPAAMAGFERLAHYGRVAGAVESIVSAAVGQGHQMRNDIVGDLLRVNEMGHAELAPPFFSLGRSEEHTSELQPLMRIT